MNIELISCISWPEFKARVISDQFSNGQFQRGRFLFRGQGGESWPLSSSFDRWYSAYNGNRANKSKIADQLLDGFIKECELEDIPQDVRQDRLLMLSMAQHNGLPTRLLDWSESPYVAAFFAFSGHIRHGKSTEKNVAIWVLDSTQDIWNAGFGCNIVTVPSFGNERIRNQHGRFTHLQTPSDSLEQYVAQFPDEIKALRKYLVPVSEAGAAMADLDCMGLNHSRIYPGLTGNAKAAEVRVVLGMYN
jgi:hypothetical protein